MISTPEIVESPAQNIAFIHVVAPRQEVILAMNQGLEELGRVLREQKIKPVGAWFTHHLRRPSETFDYRLCFPVDEEVKSEGRVEAGVLEASTVARTVYLGDYSGLGKAWGEFQAWIVAHGYAMREDLWERYLVGPDASRSPSEWKTELNRPLA